MIAWIDAQRAGLFARQYWLRNVIAGIIVGVVALPLSMAFAIATGVKPEQGIYTAIVAGIVVSVCGGSRVQIAGPTGAFIAILAGITATYGINGLQVATFLAGVMLLLMGLFRLAQFATFASGNDCLGATFTRLADYRPQGCTVTPHSIAHVGLDCRHYFASCFSV